MSISSFFPSVNLYWRKAHRDAGNRTGRGQQNHISTGGGKSSDIGLGDDLLRALRHDAGGVHLARCQDQPVPQLLPVQAQRLLDCLIGR